MSIARAFSTPTPKVVVMVVVEVFSCAFLVYVVSNVRNGF